MSLFSISGICFVLIGVRVRAISAWLHVVIVRVNWIFHTVSDWQEESLTFMHRLRDFVQISQGKNVHVQVKQMGN